MLLMHERCALRDDRANGPVRPPRPEALILEPSAVPLNTIALLRARPTPLGTLSSTSSASSPETIRSSFHQTRIIPEAPLALRTLQSAHHTTPGLEARPPPSIATRVTPTSSGSVGYTGPKASPGKEERFDSFDRANRDATPRHTAVKVAPRLNLGTARTEASRRSSHVPTLRRRCRWSSPCRRSSPSTARCCRA